ncbi:MAG: universal stress protein [Actinobacteria bacterium]|nr:universal stress protein [Actinomycetota bacterium]
MTENINAARIIVGVDGSEPSLMALRRGAQIAAALGAPVEAITTWEYPPNLDGYYPTDWSPEGDAEKILAAAVAQAFEGSPPPGFTQSVIKGPTARALIEQSAHASMLVLGSRGHGGFVGLLLGSVSAACAAHAHCPVLIMHAPDQH